MGVNVKSCALLVFFLFIKHLSALDGCHIEIRPGAEDAVDYYNYKGWYSSVLLAVVDYRFLYVNVGSPGRCNDSQIFENSALKLEHQKPISMEQSRDICGVKVPALLIGDSAFRFSNTMMKPYPYSSTATQEERNFNYALSKCRRVVENAFGHLKGRYRRIGKGLDNHIDNTNLIIKTCCVLHNFLNVHNDKFNNRWLLRPEETRNREQPEHITHIGDFNASAESIRNAISSYLSPSDVVIMILSQDSGYHKQLANNLRNNILRQSISLSNEHLVKVYVLHEIISHPGYWTFLAVMPKIVNSYLMESTEKWIIFCEDNSLIHLESLLYHLSKEDYSEELFLGYPLYDQEATIIHHFAFFKDPRWFPYPMLHSGVIFSVPLVQRVAKYVLKVKRKMDFSIDASHELARFIMEHVKPKSHMHHVPRSTTKDERDVATKGFVSHVTMRNGDNKAKKKANSKILMQPVSYICPLEEVPHTNCALYVNSSVASACMAVSAETIYFAIKTCHKFLSDRVPVIQKTWGRYAVHKRFFSDKASKDVPTIATGVPNTETGHCLKTLSILKLALSDVEWNNRISKKPILWIFLSDDDTILSVSGVCEILGCFDPDADVYLGERYGFRLHSDDGFNYITGGGGIAFSLPTVRKIVQSCTCPTISSPDDMILGSCLHGLDVKAIHSSRFHQARPSDYAKPLLLVQKPISFHKFWQTDPFTLYKEWFATDDAKLKAQMPYSNSENKGYTEKVKKEIQPKDKQRSLIDIEIKIDHAEL